MNLQQRSGSQKVEIKETGLKLGGKKPTIADKMNTLNYFISIFQSCLIKSPVLINLSSASLMATE